VVSIFDRYDKEVHRMTVEDIGWNLQRESIAFSRLLVFS